MECEKLPCQFKMAVLSISFKDRLCFEAHSDFLLNSAYLPPKTPYLPQRRDSESRNKINLDLSLLRTRLTSGRHCNNVRGWRWVDFTPKSHTHAPKTIGMVFRDKGPFPKGGGGGRGRGEGGRGGGGGGGEVEYKKQHLQRFPITISGKADDKGSYKYALDIVLAHQLGMEDRRRRRSGRGRGVSSGATPFKTRFQCSKSEDDVIRERRDYGVYPYTNPQPYDHRGVREGQGGGGRDGREGGMGHHQAPPPYSWT